MNRPAKIRAIYAELRSALGEQATREEILVCADLVLGSLDPDPYAPVDRSFLEGRMTIDQMPLYDVFAKKSWHLLYKERIGIVEDFEGRPANDFIAEQLGMTDLRMCA